MRSTSFICCKSRHSDGRMAAFDASLIEDLPEAAAALGLESLRIRREDQNGIGIGGTKSRTMARALSAAAGRGATVLVMPARAGSNAVLAASVLARDSGLRVHAVLRPQPHSAEALRNLTLIHASGCAVTPVGLDVSLRLDQPLLTELAAQLIAQGDRPEFLPFGAATIEAGIVHFAALRRLDRQWRASGTRPPDRLYMASASYDSGAGILAGLALARWPTQLVLINVAQDQVPAAETVQAKAISILKRARVAAAAVPMPEIRDYLAPGFGRIDRASLDCVTRLALPVQLDPSYTAKALAALIDDAKAEATRRPLLWYGCPDTAQLGQALRGVCVPQALVHSLLFR
jgi:1-aminocyclopropane-1-carboxylate deaminase/D-cysteine desulfhydrase-like pyridoxal-dependent ACC family enzyme